MSTPTGYFQQFMEELEVTHQGAVWLYRHLLQNCRDQQFSYFYLEEPLARLEYIDKKTNQRVTLPVNNKSNVRNKDVDVLINHHFFYQIPTDKNFAENGTKIDCKIRDQKELDEYINSRI